MKYTIIKTTLETTERTHAANDQELVEFLNDMTLYHDSDYYMSDLKNFGNAAIREWRQTISIFAHD